MTPHRLNPAPQAKSVRRANSIAFLRLALAFTVLYSHAHLLGGFGKESFLSWSRGSLILGSVGVQGFFVLSGSLIATSWIRRATLGRFLWCRFLRLAPAFWVCLAVTSLVFGPAFYFTSPGPHLPYFSLQPSALGYLLRNGLNPRAQIAIGPLPGGVPWSSDWNGSLWTLFYEAACYLMVAGLGVAGLLGRSRRLGAAAIVGLLALFTFWSVASPAVALPRQVGRIFDTPGKVLTLYFLAGTGWALFPDATRAWTRAFWPGLLACFVLVACWHWGAYRWLGPWIMPPALFWLAANLPFAGFEDWAGGDYSYGLYIYAYPVQQMLAHFGAASLGYPLYLAAGFCGAGLLAIASWHWIEKPALGLKNLAFRPGSGQLAGC